MSYGDAYADAHLTLEALNADIAEASGMLERAVENWERILNVQAAVDIDTAGATALIEQVASEWGAIIEENLTGSVDIDTSAATAEIVAATQTWQSLVESITATVDLDTDEANDELAATVLVWREAVSSNLTATVTMNTDPANDALVESIIAWRSAVQDDLTANVDMRTGDATAELDAASEVWRRVVASSLVAEVDMDTGAATAQLASAAAVWQQIVGADLVAVVSLSTDRANDTLAESVLAWRAAVASSLVAEVDIDTEATTGKLLIAVEGWQSLLTDGITATVDMDTTAASERLNLAVDEWNVQVGEGVAVGVTLDTSTPTEELAIATEEWQAMVEDAIEASVEMNTAAATDHLATTVEEWRALVDPIPANVDMDTGEADAILAASAAEWRAITADAVSARAEMDTAVATDHLAGAVEEWRAIVAENLVMEVDLDTDGADDHLIETIADWRTRALVGVTVPVNIDTGASGTEFEARLAEWQALAHIDIDVTVDDVESLANLATTFAGLRPLTDLPVRFHLDQPSVELATAEVQGLAATWSEILDLGVRPSQGPVGENDAPVRPGTSPASPRGPPTSTPTIRPQVDGTEAESQAALLDKVLKGILTVTTTVRLDEAEALAQSEALAPAIERVLATSADVKLDGDGAVEYAEALHDLIEQVLTGLQVVPGVDGERAIAQAEELDRLLSAALAVTANVDLDDSAVTAEAIRLSAELDRLLGDIDLKVKPDLDDPAPVLAEMKSLNKLFEDVLKVVVPAKFDDPAILAKAETLAPLIKEALRVVSEVDIDGAGAVPAAEAIGRVLSQAVDITAPVKVGDKEAIAKLTALDGVFQTLLRDLHVKINLDGGEATAEAELLLKVLGEQHLHIKAELDKAKALADGILLNKELSALAGKLHIDVDIDSASAKGRTAGAAFIRNIDDGIKAFLPNVLSSLGSLLNIGGAGGSGGSAGFKSLFDGAAQSGGVLSGIMSELGSKGSALGGMFSQIGSVGGSAFSSIGSGAASLVTGTVQLAAVIAAVSVALAAATAAAAALAAGIGAVLAAGAGLVGLAGGFLSVAGGIGVAAGAAGALGIALNKDLAAQATEGMTTLKNAVASATRQAGQDILDKFLGPYTVALTSIARSASKLTPLLVDPIAEAGLRFTGVINQILESDVGASIASKLGNGIAGFFDQFTSVLPQYASLIDDVLGKTTGLQDIVQTVLNLGLKAEPLFLSLGNLLSSIAISVNRFGDTGLDLVTRITDKLGELLTGDTFNQFVDLGADVLNSILDLLGQLSDGFQSVGLDSVFARIGQAITDLVDSGFFERVGSFLGQLTSLGADLLGPLFDSIISVGDTVMEVLEPLLPIIDNLFTTLGAEVPRLLDGLSDSGILESFGELMGNILFTIQLLLPGITDLATIIGYVLTPAIDLVNLAFQGFYWFIGQLGEAIAGLEGILTSVVGAILGKLGSLARFIADDLAFALPESVSQTFRMAADSADNLGASLQITGSVMTDIVAPSVGNLGTQLATAGDAAERSAILFGLSGDEAARASDLQKEYGDALGEGAAAVALYGDAHGLTAAQMDEAAAAAVAAADQFQYTTDLVSKMREELAKPIELKFDFDKTKLDLDGLVKYVDSQVKTVRDNASKPINTDPETERLASAVKGADGTSLNDATSGSHEELIPEHLDTSVADAVQEMYDNAIRDIDNASYLKELRFNGFSALADQLEQFDGPKLELAIQELGNSTSAAVKAANGKIEDAQKERDQNFNPFQTAIDDAKKQGVLKVRQVEIVQELESKGFDDLASQVAAIKPEDLEAAIRTYDNLTPEVVAGMEKQLDDLSAALSAKVTEIDPIGKMWEAAGNTPGAQEGLIGKIVTPDQIEAAVGDNFDNHFNPDQKGLADLLNIVGAAIQSPAGTGGIADMKPEDVQRWKNLFNGFDPNTGKPVENVTDEEAQIISLLKLREAKGKGQTVGADGTITAGQAEATSAGKAVADAFASSMTNGEGSKIVTDAANSMIDGAVNTMTAAVAKSAGHLVADGIEFVKLLGTGMDAGTFLHIVPAAIRLITTTIDIIDTALSQPEAVIGSGRVLANSIAVGVLTGAVLSLYPTIITVGATATELAVASIANASSDLLDSGKSVPSFLSAGVLLGLPAIVNSLKIMGDLMVAMIQEETKRAAFAANLMGQSIGNAIGEGLRASIASIGLDGTNPEDGDGKKGGGLIGGRGAVDQAADAAKATVTGPGVSIGSAIIDGMIAGMNARLPDLITATQLIAAQMAQTMRESLQVRSPSRVTMTIGEQVAEGLARGIENGNDRVIVSAQTLGDRIGSAIADAVTVPDITLPAADPARPTAWPESIDQGDNRSPFAAPPAVTLPSQTDLLESLRTAANAAAQPQQGPGATPAAPGGVNAAQALLAGPGGDRALVTVQGDLVINGVPGAEELPQRVEGEFWRIDYGQSPRRPIS